jgi:hypothetical protein
MESCSPSNPPALSMKYDVREMTAQGLLSCLHLTQSPGLYLAALSVVAVVSFYISRGHSLSYRLDVAEISVAGIAGLFLLFGFLCFVGRRFSTGAVFEFLLLGLIFVYPHLTIAALIGLVHLFLRSAETRIARHTICVSLIVISAGIASAILAAR